MSFQKWVCQKIGKAQWDKTKDFAKRKMLSEFEYSIKRGFGISTQTEYSVELRGVEDDPEQGIRDEMINVKRYSHYGLIPCFFG